MQIYLSHSIRGRFGAAATKEQMDFNCEAALRFGRWVRKEFPQIDIYIPAESEPFVGAAYWHEFLSEEQILRVDCEILNTCDGMIVFAPDNFISKGMSVEVEWCKEHKIPYLLVSEQMLKIKESIDCTEKDIINDWLEFLERKQNGTSN